MPSAKTKTAITKALIALAAERDWEDVTLEGIAERADVTLAVLRGAYNSRLEILADLSRHVDGEVLAERDPDLADEAPRERLFDLLFARLEALEPYRPALRNIGEAVRRDPLLVLALNRIVVTSMVWMMTGAGLSATGSRGALRAQGLAFVWGRVLRVWLDDDDLGRSRTMAELDRRLREAERTMMRLGRLRRLFRSSGGQARMRREQDTGTVRGGYGFKGEATAHDD
jgi:AcrR family transcriptional regulator